MMNVVRMSITIPKDIKKKLEDIAKKELRTRSNMIAKLIQEYQVK